MAKIILCLALVAYFVYEADSSAEVMKEMSKKLGKALDDCKSELNLPDSIMNEFNTFWKDENQLTNRDLGCAIMCLAKKMDFIDTDGSLHHGNAKEFAMKHGADGAVAQQMVDLLHNCHTASPPNDDACIMALDVSRCFREGIKKLNWVPQYDVIVGEILSEI